MSIGRFDYIRYDEESHNKQLNFKLLCETLEEQVNLNINCPRSKATALTKLEELYAWIGKGIRNDQANKNAKVIVNERRG